MGIFLVGCGMLIKISVTFVLSTELFNSNGISWRERIQTHKLIEIGSDPLDARCVKRIFHVSEQLFHYKSNRKYAVGVENKCLLHFRSRMTSHMGFDYASKALKH